MDACWSGFGEGCFDCAKEGLLLTDRFIRIAADQASTFDCPFLAAVIRTLRWHQQQKGEPS